MITWLFLLIVSRDHVQGGAAAGPYLQTLGASLPEATAWINQIVTIVFILGALMFYSLLYRSRLIPRWISGRGLIAAIPYLAAGFSVMFGLIHERSTFDTLLRLPVAMQEMVLAVWLIVKGFHPSALASLSTRVDMD